MMAYTAVCAMHSAITSPCNVTENAFARHVGTVFPEISENNFAFLLSNRQFCGRIRIQSKRSNTCLVRDVSINGPTYIEWSPDKLPVRGLQTSSPVLLSSRRTRDVGSTNCRRGHRLAEQGFYVFGTHGPVGIFSRRFSVTRYPKENVCIPLRIHTFSFCKRAHTRFISAYSDHTALSDTQSSSSSCRTEDWHMSANARPAGTPDRHSDNSAWAEQWNAPATHPADTPPAG